MLTIKSWCLPNDLPQNELEEIHNAIVAAVISVPETGVKNEDDMLNLLPPDWMTYGLGSVIKIEVTDLPAKSSKAARDKLAAAIGQAMKAFFPRTRIQCKVSEEDPRDGSWSSY